MRKLRIGIASTEGQGLGGAVRATRRLMDGLRQRGHDVYLISLGVARGNDAIGVSAAPPRSADDGLALNANLWLQQNYIAPRRTAVSNTFFSAEVAGFGLGNGSLAEQFDILNLHWTANFLAPHTLAELLSRQCPVLCTLHDMAAFTGGCHYTAGCERYREQCSPCPQLQSDELGLTRWTLEQKRRCLTAEKLRLIAPSRWLANCAVESGLFAPERVCTIANGLDTDIFRPTETIAAKRLLGIDPRTKTLLFGAADNREHRKGFDLLVEVWRHIADDARVKDLLAERRIRVLVFGEGTDALEAVGTPTLNLGAIHNESRLALIYSAADLLVLSSRQDNLPNILLESMACATPAIAFDIGGVPDVVRDRVNGRLIPPFDIAEMSRAMVESLTRDETVTAMGAMARKTILEHHDLDSQAAAYEELFMRLLQEKAFDTPARPLSLTSVPDTITCPVTLNPNLGAHPIRLFLEQCEKIAQLERRSAELANHIERTNDVLGTAIGEVVAARSWRYPRLYWRNPRNTAVNVGSSPEQNAVALLNLLRSKCWELTGPLRLLSRALDWVPRQLERWRTHQPLGHQSSGGEVPLPPHTFMVDVQRVVTKRRSPHQRESVHVICLHLFHLDLWEEFRQALQPLIDAHTLLYVTLPVSNAHFLPVLQRELGEQFCRVFVIENRGLDIYPFLYVFDQLSAVGPKPLTLTKLHTKKSVHHGAESAEKWRKDLYRDLLHHHRSLTGQFHLDTVAMICSRKWWVHEDETSENFRIERRAIESACRLFGVSRTEYYLSGSMYIVSFDYLQKLFAGVDRHKLLAGFLPGYQRSDTLAHGVERVICYGVEKFALKVGLI